MIETSNPKIIYKMMPHLVSYHSPYMIVIFWLAASLLVSVSLFAVFFYKWKVLTQVLVFKAAVHTRLATILEITPKESDKRLQLSAKIIKCMNEGVIVTDLNGNIMTTNLAFTRLTGYREEEAQGRNLSLLLSEQFSPGFLNEVWEKLIDCGYWQGEIRNKHRSGLIHVLNMRVYSIYSDNGQLECYAAIMEDITERKLNEEKMRYRAYYDSLTALPNREFFHNRLIQAFEEAKQNQSRIAVMFLDVDGFKGVNDSYGHLVGDQLLQEFAGRIKFTQADSSDNIARFGGDEFILFTEIHTEREAASLAEALLTTISKPYRINDCSIEISCSIGISLYPDQGQDVQDLIKLADEAMYIAKKRGKNNYQFRHQSACGTTLLQR
ncbi:sensor domain-containing diguanylate cyclase [Cohnella phaseoli]|uniref:PAS domain S-box-containing protein/diguanylate cyclase (GGDEF)-like protein n=1 Tax=Cohnella phaseoli TaxID=456490 RepID=A0A3D9KSW3_9BACL|nr:sensor domain-containing diguanylate cyclase [Cohnella phaseoli]RED89078.1 PAS domain S-box-containing protein/diguanylate cyclase (GGDEF)-like protein [Cohnella phaseoli]